MRLLGMICLAYSCGAMLSPLYFLRVFPMSFYFSSFIHLFSIICLLVRSCGSQSPLRYDIICWMLLRLVPIWFKLCCYLVFIPPLPISLITPGRSVARLFDFVCLVRCSQFSWKSRTPFEIICFPNDSAIKSSGDMWLPDLPWSCVAECFQIWYNIQHNISQIARRLSSLFLRAMMFCKCAAWAPGLQNCFAINCCRDVLVWCEMSLCGFLWNIEMSAGPWTRGQTARVPLAHWSSGSGRENLRLSTPGHERQLVYPGPALDYLRCTIWHPVSNHIFILPICSRIRRATSKHAETHTMGNNEPTLEDVMKRLPLRTHGNPQDLLNYLNT